MSEGRYMIVYTADYTTSIAGRDHSIVWRGQKRDELENICKKYGFLTEKDAEKQVGDIYRRITRPPYFIWDNKHPIRDYAYLLKVGTVIWKYHRAVERRKEENKQ